MGEPVRIQLSRRKGWRMVDAADNGLPTVKVDRTSRWGNQFAIIVSEDGRFEIRRSESYRVEPLATAEKIEDARAAAVAHFRDWALGQFGYHFRLRVEADLRGKNLACWCPLPEPCEPDCCHAAVLLEIANAANEPQGLREREGAE